MIDFLKDLWDFMRERKKFWLAPIIIVMLLLGVLIVVAQGSAVAPFIYTLFYPVWLVVLDWKPSSCLRKAWSAASFWARSLSAACVSQGTAHYDIGLLLF
jgi:hypothetical protein